jgi:hypothetical protein
MNRYYFYQADCFIQNAIDDEPDTKLSFGNGIWIVEDDEATPEYILDSLLRWLEQDLLQKMNANVSTPDKKLANMDGSYWVVNQFNRVE